jgi:hypothetical protein
MRNLILLGAAVVVLVATALAGHYVGNWWEGKEKPPRPVVIDTSTSSRTIPQPEPDLRPQVVTLYDTTTEVRQDTLFVPVGLNVGGIIGQNPVTREDRWFGRDRLQLTYFDPNQGTNGRYVRESYGLPRPPWEAWLDVGTGLSSDLVPATGGTVEGLRLHADVKAWLRYRRLRGYAGVGARGTRLIGEVGVRTRIFSYSWD